MQLVTFYSRGETRLGVLANGRVVDLNRAYAFLCEEAGDARPLASADYEVPADMVRFLEGGEHSMAAAGRALEFVRQASSSTAAKRELIRRGVLLDPGEVALKAPVPRPGKIICTWVNYKAHGEEASIEAPTDVPVFFAKFSTSVIGPGEPIVLPRISSKVDYEAELAFVIGKRGKDISGERAFEFIAGYTIFNDVSARDFSLKAILGVMGPYIIQKTFDTFAPMGPFLVTKEEISDPHNLDIKLSIGGEMLQDSNTSHMIFKIPEIVAYISRIVTLEPGDVISTGTPPGVGVWRKPPRFLKPGDTVRIEISGLGVLENPVVDAQ